GDLTHLNVSSDKTVGLLRLLRAAEIPTVAVFLSGRPLWVTPEINVANSFVAAWLPGSEGAGVADVLFRQASGNADFRGKLSFPWPRTAVRASRGENDHAPLFPYGYGLTYGDNGNLAQLPETSGLDGSEKIQDGALFALGRPVAPWSLQATVGNTSNTVVAPRTQLQNALTIRSIDRAAQEDAQQFVWSGQDTAAIVFTGPADYIAASPRGLVIQYRVDTPPAGPVTLFSKCGDDSRALDVTQLFADAPVGEWTQTVITLDELAAAGANNLTALGLETASPFALSLSDMGWVQTGEPG
ncbi:MAG: putative glycoside hydrolase, partial [Cyanobacteria bacterium P01_D01_bin.2]